MHILTESEEAVKMMPDVNRQNKIICVVGPTASGKSALAVKLAKEFDGEIISCDSMQLYRGMDIGTAKATQQEMDGIAHHLLDTIDIDDEFSVSDYVKLADECVKDISSRGKLPIFCGGTGLYIDSYISGMSFGEYENLPEYRKELEEFAKDKGAEALHKMLQECDSEAAEKIDCANVKRVIRALEVYKATGVPISKWNKQAKENAKPRDALYIGITFEDRQKLYERIDRRVDIMLESGLLEETEKLISEGLRSSATASQAIGYKELYPYFDGQAVLSDCVERLKINSRHYAKRQLTWFTRNKEIKWIYADGKTGEQLALEAVCLCREYLCGKI